MHADARDPPDRPPPLTWNQRVPRIHLNNYSCVRGIRDRASKNVYDVYRPGEKKSLRSSAIALTRTRGEFAIEILRSRFDNFDLVRAIFDNSECRRLRSKYEQAFAFAFANLGT